MAAPDRLTETESYLVLPSGPRLTLVEDGSITPNHDDNLVAVLTPEDLMVAGMLRRAVFARDALIHTREQQPNHPLIHMRRYHRYVHNLHAAERRKDKAAQALQLAQMAAIDARLPRPENEPSHWLPEPQTVHYHDKALRRELYCAVKRHLRPLMDRVVAHL